MSTTDHILPTMKDLKVGDHLCCLYETTEEYLATVGPFLCQGLEKGETVCYTTNVETAELVLAYLRNNGLAVDSYLASGQLSLLRANQTYMPDGTFEPDRMLAFLQSMTAEAISNGYPALRYIGEVTALLPERLDFKHFIEYEAKLHTFFSNNKCSALCLYHRHDFAPEVLLQVLTTHPLVIANTEIYNNFYHIPSANFQEHGHATAILQHWLENLGRHKQMEMALQTSEELHRIILSNISDAVFITTDAGNFTYICPRVDVLFGYDPQEVQALGNISALLDNHLFTVDELDTLGEIKNIEHEITDKSGKPLTLLINIKRVSIGGGTVLYTCRDITERKQAEEALAENQRRLQALFDHAQDAIILADDQARYVDANPAACNLTGYSRQEILQMAVMDLTPAPTRDHGLELWRSFVEAGEQQGEYTLNRKDGTRVEVEYRAVANIVPGLHLAILRDVTGRKQTGEKIRHYAVRMEALAQISQLLVEAGLDIEAVFRAITRHTAETIGDACVLALFSNEEAVLKPAAFHHPKPKARALMARLLTAVPKQGDSDWSNYILKTGQPILIPELPQEQIHYRFQPKYRPYLEQVGLYSMLIVPLRVEHHIIGTLGVTRDSPGQPYTSDDQTFLQSLADRAALTITNVKLFEAEHQQRLQAETLREATLALTSQIKLDAVLDEILRQVQRIVSYRTANIMLLKGDMLHIASWRGYDKIGSEELISNLKQSLAEFPFERRVVQNKQPVIIADTYREPDWIILDQTVWIRSHLVIPICLRDQILGLLRLDGATPGEFSIEDANHLHPLANAAAIAMENARLFEQVRIGHQRLRALSRKLLAVQEAERRHIARELHDEVGQVLTGLKLLLEMSTDLLAPTTGANLNEARELVQELMERVDELSLDLRPAMLDHLGLLPTLLWHFERYTQQTSVQVIFKHSGLEGKRFASEVETAAYRLVQEALTNVARHAQVSKVIVQVWVKQKILNIQIEDQGVGFDPQTTQVDDTSSGLSGMRERVVLLDGQLTIEAAPKDGTTLIAQLPLSVSL